MDAARRYVELQGRKLNQEELDNSIACLNDHVNSIRDFSVLFKVCDLTNLDISKLITHHVINMSHMFNSCFFLSSAFDLSFLNTISVTNMSGMFQRMRCHSLDLSEFDTSSVYHMSYMFSSLTLNHSHVIDISSFKTSSATNMSGMFYDLKIQELIFSLNFTSSNVHNMNRMFAYCDIGNLDVSNFDTSKEEVMLQMFNGATLTNIELRNFSFAMCTDMRQALSFRTIRRCVLFVYKDDTFPKVMRSFCSDRFVDRFEFPEKYITAFDFFQYIYTLKILAVSPINHYLRRTSTIQNLIIEE